MTDQELADAIREKFGNYRTFTGNQDTAAMDFGYAVASFCTSNPAWTPTPGCSASWGRHSVVVVGEDPNDPKRTVVYGRSLMKPGYHPALTAELEPTRPEQGA